MMFPKPEKKVKKPRKGLRRHSNNPLQIAHDRAWKAFSKWVRVSNADWKGDVACFTCGRVYPWQQMDAGHFFHNVLDFNIYNIHPQCKRCNKYKQGEGVAYYEKLRELYGQEVVEGLIEEKWKEKSGQIIRTVEDYEGLEYEYKQKLSEL